MTLLQSELPGYELEREIHRGGQGVVYQALQISTRRQVAIKVMKEGPFAGVEDKARFDREVRIVAQLDHPSIVAIHDTGTAAGCFYSVMNYIAGSPLDVYVREAAPSLEETLRLYVKICEAVNAAHLRGIVHRDLKPSNIRIDVEGQPHVLDFGLAKVEDGGAATGGSVMPVMTQTGQFVGSLPWASPEQAAGVAGGIDVRSDVYSLGVVLYQLLTGTFPYDVHGGMLEVAQRIVHAEPVRPRVAAAARGLAGRFRINGEVETIILKCLSKDAQRRYQNAGELAGDLGRYLAGEPIDARRDSLTYVLRTHVRRHRLGVAFACTMLLVLVAGLIVSLTFWRQAESARIDLQGALDRADQRENDLRQVAEAQSKMLSGVDPQTMGMRLRQDLLAEARAAMERAGAGPEDLAARVDQLDSMLSGTNFTNLGTQSIHQNMLAPALLSIERDYEGQPLVQAALWQTIAKLYDHIGLYPAGVPAAERAIATRRRELGETHPDTLDSIKTLYWLLQKQGKLDEAEPHLREWLGGLRQTVTDLRHSLGDDHPATLRAMNLLGGVLWSVDMFAEAEPVLREVVERRRRLLGNDHPDTLGPIASLGVTLRDLNRMSEAEPYYREAMEGRRRVLGMSNQQTLISISNMGLLLTAMGRLEEAEPYQREAMEGYRRTFGDDHQWTHVRIRNMAMLMEFQGRYAEAEEYQRECESNRRRVKGDDHPDTLLATAWLVKFLMEQGKYSEAEPLCRRALERCRRVLGDDHEITLVTRSCLGGSLAGLGKLNEGEAIGAEVVARAREVSLPHPWFLSMFLTAHARSLAAMGRFHEAEAELIEAHELVANRMTLSYPRTIAAIRTLADFYDAWHTVEPQGGHDIAAAAWRAKLAASGRH